MADFFSGLLDPQFRQDTMRGLLDAGNRGVVGGLLGAPVDLATMALRPLGYSVANPVGGSEWIGQKMQDAGLVSPERNRLAELLAGFAGPMGAQQAAPKLNALAEVLRSNMGAPETINLGMRGQAGMIRIPGRGQIPETGSDVNQLANRFGRLLDDAGVNYAADKSGLSPARYFTFDKPGTADPQYGAEGYKVRISDHRNVHGADFSVDPDTGKTFEEMLAAVQGMGVPIANRVKPLAQVVKPRAQLIDDLVMGRTASNYQYPAGNPAYQGLIDRAEAASTPAQIAALRAEADAASQASRGAFVQANGFDPGHPHTASLFNQLKSGAMTLGQVQNQGYDPAILQMLKAQLAR